MQTPNIVRSIGYLVSTLSVLLLGAVSWKPARQSPVLVMCRVLGIAARGLSCQIDKE